MARLKSHGRFYESAAKRAAAEENQGQYYLPLRYKTEMLACTKAIEGDAINGCPII